ncbi:hypothetical protein ABIC03_007900 [Bradyrhizobium sp. RT6a]
MAGAYAERFIQNFNGQLQDERKRCFGPTFH